MGTITQLVSAYWEETEQVRQSAARGKDEIDRMKRQLQELVSMRAARLVADDEFMTQREQLRKKLFELQASRLNDSDASLTETEVGELTGAVSDLETTWRTVPVGAKRGFGVLVFPAGFVFQRVRTAQKGLLFKTFGPSNAGPSNVVPHVRGNVNTIIAEI